MASPYAPEFCAKVSQEYLGRGSYPFLAEKYNIGKTSIEERRGIVSHCLNHGHGYKGTADVYRVSYSQVYSWVKKYEASGEEGLADRRGHHKADDKVDEPERLRRENARLKRQMEEKDMVI